MTDNKINKDNSDKNKVEDCLSDVPDWLREAATQTPRGAVSLSLYGKNDGTRRGRHGRKSHNKFDD